MRAAIAALAALPLCACGGVGPTSAPPVAETAPPILASADPFMADAELHLPLDAAVPATLSGRWRVDTGGRNCGLTLVVTGAEMQGETAGCSESSEVRQIAIGLASGGSFLFQTGRGSAGWIWSGRYVAGKDILEGRREHVITGQLESFVARR